MELNSGFKLFKNSAIYSIVTFLKYSTGFILLPLYTNYLSTDSYGILSLSISFISIGVIVYALSLDSSIAKFFYAKKNDKEFKKYLISSLWGIVIFSLSLSLILIVCVKLYFEYWVTNQYLFKIFLLSIISVTFQPIYNYYDAYLRALQKAKLSSFFSFSYFFIQLALILVNVCVFKMQIEGVLLAYAISNILFACISFFLLIKENGYFGDYQYLKETLKYSLPIVPHSLLGWGISMIDRLFIAMLLTVGAVGLYNVSYQIGSILFIISVMAVHSAYGPWFLEQVSTNTIDNIVRYSTHLVKIYCVVCFFLSLFSFEIVNLLAHTKDFHDSWILVPLMSISFLFYAIYFLYINVFYVNRTTLLPKLTFFSFLFSCIANYFLIIEFGLIGAALSAALVKLVFVFVTYRYAQKEFFIPYKVKEIALYVSVTIIFSMLVYLLPENEGFTMLFAKIFIFLIAVVIVCLLNRKDLFKCYQVVFESYRNKNSII